MLNLSNPSQLQRSDTASACRLAATGAATMERPPSQSGSSSEEEQVYDCVVVGGGISGLTTAQACLSEHGDTVKRCALALNALLASGRTILEASHGSPQPRPASRSTATP